MSLAWWEIVVIPVLTLILNFLAYPVKVYVWRKRQGAINGVRVIAGIFSEYTGKPSAWDQARTDALWAQISQWQSYPNSLGSEARLAVLVGEFCQAYGVSETQRRLMDRALNSLDQRATERERSKNGAKQS